MALDPEELQRRRQEREKQRAKRKAQKRKLILYLVIAAVILLACTLLIVNVVRSRPDETTPVSSNTPPQDSASASADATEPPATTVIHLAAAGDLNVTDSVVSAGGLGYDYTNAFLDVAHIFADADISILNYEGNLCGSPYGTDSASAPQGLMESLRRAGVDVIQLANSYSINHGMSGLADTINGVQAAGMIPLGVYANEDAYKSGKGYTIINVQGVRIAFVAFTKGMDGMALPDDSLNCVNVLYTDYESTYQAVDKDRINKVLDAAAAEKPDLTIVMLHWGSEYKDGLSTSQTEIVTLLQEKGVDAIIGTHSHYVQQMDYDPETGMFVAYSLGDFFGDGKKPGTEYSVILDLEITKNNETGETKITSYSYTPIFTVSDDGNLRVVRISEAMTAYEADYLGKISKETYEDMQYALTRIEDRTATPEETTEEEE